MYSEALLFLLPPFSNSLHVGTLTWKEQETETDKQLSVLIFFFCLFQ